MAAPPYLCASSDGVELMLHIQPRASKTGFQGEHDGRLKIRLAAPPVDGAATDELTRFLATAFGVQRRAAVGAKGRIGRRHGFVTAGTDRKLFLPYHNPHLLMIHDT